MSKARDLASAAPAPSTVSATELGYVDGVTSAIQTQIDSKIGSASAINPTIVDAKGDIIAASAADTPARLAVGANDTVLTADSSTATGLKWATPAAATPVFVGCQLFMGASVTLSNNTFTAIPFAETDYIDTDGFHNPASNNTRITIPSGKTGKYLVTGYILQDTGVNSARTRIYLNGTGFVEARYALGGDDNGMGLTVIMNLSAGDYIELYGYQNTGGNNAVYGSTDLGIKATSFGVQYLGT